MVAVVLSVIFLVVALYGYYSSIKMSKLEKEIRKQGLDYECFECKKKFSINETKCPHCSFVTIYGKRKSKFWVILPILGIWLMVVAKWNKVGMF